MERDFLFLEAGMFGYAVRAADCVRKLGYRAVLLARNPEDYASAVVDPRPFMDEIVAVDTFDIAKLLRIALDRRPPGALGFDDYRLIPAALVSSSVNGGGSTEGLLNVRFKDRMRGLLAGSEFDVPHAAHDLDVEAPRSSAVGYPCVVKPVDEGGSFGVRICYDDADFAAAIGTLQSMLGTANSRGYRSSRGILVEAFIPGQEYSAELVYDPANARWHLVGITQKLVSEPPYCVEVGHLFPAPVAPETRTEVERFLGRLLTRLGLRNTAAHVEFKLDGDRIRVIEVNPRLGGDMIVKLVEAALGIDLIEILVRLHAGLPVHEQVVPTRALSAAVRFIFPPRPGVLTGLKLPPPGPAEVTRWSSPMPRTIGTVTSSYDRLGFVVFAADDTDDLRAAVEDFVSNCEFAYEEERTQA